MDSSARDFELTKNGCNYCQELIDKNFKTKNTDKDSLDRIIKKIKSDGHGKKYDCIVGVSGGVDSSYVLKIAKDFNLRVLAVHMDNGWNSELAQNNIQRIIEEFGYDFYSHVINWNEYRLLMQSFFDSDVIDIELLYDNAMYAVNYNLAIKYKVKWILNGINNSTEGMRLPQDWTWFKFDSKNIKDIVKKNGNYSIETFPLMSIWKALYARFFLKINFFSVLDHIDYKKTSALEYLTSIGYKPYPYKHYESIFTRFYQGYILREKFGVDKRKVHLSTLLINNQISHKEASKLLQKIPYPDERALEEDKKYFLKKMNWNEDDLCKYLQRPPAEHKEYKNDYIIWKNLIKIRNRFKNIFN